MFRKNKQDSGAVGFLPPAQTEESNFSVVAKPVPVITHHEFVLNPFFDDIQYRSRVDNQVTHIRSHHHDKMRLASEPEPHTVARRWWEVDGENTHQLLNIDRRPNRSAGQSWENYHFYNKRSVPNASSRVTVPDWQQFAGFITVSGLVINWYDCAGAAV